MPEVEITRKQIIVVGEVVTNQYGDLTWTDKEGKSYKVKSTRKQYFECIVPDQAVEISFSKYRNIEYPYSATAVADTLPAVKPTHLTDKGELKPKEEMTKTDWSEKDRITRKSIERQTALKEANVRVPAGESSEKVIATAKLFEAYLEEGDVQQKNILVKEAIKLGATKGN